MQAAEDRLACDGANFWSLNRPRFRRVLLKPKMCPRFMIIGQVLIQYPPKMVLTQNDHMVETLPPDRPDDPFTVSVLPWRPGSGDDLFNVQDTECVNNLRTKGAIPIPDQIPRGGIEGKGLDQLQACPVGSGIACDVEVDDASPVERKDQEYIERPKGNGRDREEIDGDDLGCFLPAEVRQFQV